MEVVARTGSFVLGAIVGGIAALLFAPTSGIEFREEMIDRYQIISYEALDFVESVCDHSRDLIDRAKEIAENKMNRRE